MLKCTAWLLKELYSKSYCWYLLHSCSTKTNRCRNKSCLGYKGQNINDYVYIFRLFVFLFLEKTLNVNHVAFLNIFFSYMYNKTNQVPAYPQQPQSKQEYIKGRGGRPIVCWQRNKCSASRARTHEQQNDATRLAGWYTTGEKDVTATENDPQWDSTSGPHGCKAVTEVLGFGGFFSTLSSFWLFCSYCGYTTAVLHAEVQQKCHFHRTAKWTWVKRIETLSN